MEKTVVVLFLNIIASMLHSKRKYKKSTKMINPIAVACIMECSKKKINPKLSRKMTSDPKIKQVLNFVHTYFLKLIL